MIEPNYNANGQGREFCALLNSTCTFSSQGAWIARGCDRNAIYLIGRGVGGAES